MVADQPYYMSAYIAVYALTINSTDPHFHS